MNIRLLDFNGYLTPEECKELDIDSSGALVKVSIREDVGFDGSFSEKAGAKVDFFEACVDDGRELIGRIRNGQCTGISFSFLNVLLAKEIRDILLKGVL